MGEVYINQFMWFYIKPEKISTRLPNIQLEFPRNFLDHCFFPGKKNLLYFPDTGNIVIIYPRLYRTISIF